MAAVKVVVKVVPAVAELWGSLVKRILFAAAGDTTVVGLLVAVLFVKVSVVSVAVSVQLTPVLIMTPLNVATPADAVAL
jgi:hypothetical protein